MLKCCKWRGKEIPQIFKDTRAAQKSLLTLLCCILTLTDSDESDESDNDDDNDNSQQCVVCKCKKRNLILVSKIPKQTLQTILLYCEDIEMFVESDKICRQDIGYYELMNIDPNKTGLSEVPGRQHQDKCATCSDSLLLTEDANNEVLDYNSGFILGSRNIIEYKEHFHLATQEGYVPEAKRAFVKFALRCKNKENKRLHLTQCYCPKCHKRLKRKFEYGKLGIYYSPVKMKEENGAFCHKLEAYCSFSEPTLSSPV